LDEGYVMNIIPVIMAGGAGTRLWPMSRKEKPKQFLNLSGKGTLFGETVKRLLPLEPEEIVVVTSRDYSDLTREEFRNINIPATVLAEPAAKNTAAAILFASRYIEKKFSDSIMIVLPADHYISDEDSFREDLNRAIGAAQKGSLVTLGIKPTYGETGYGYIKSHGAGEVLDVDAFVEKPDEETADLYVKSGNYLWNSGIFIWKTETIMREFLSHMKPHVDSFSMLKDFTHDEIAGSSDDVIGVIDSIFQSLESISIDVGVLEKAQGIKMIPGDFGWKDLGSWKSIDDILESDEQLNRTPVPQQVLFEESTNTSVFAESSKVAVIGLENVTVIQAGDNILVINKDQSQLAKKASEHFS
jgi:mannose-1-phosphate guanylyltransferase